MMGTIPHEIEDHAARVARLMEEERLAHQPARRAGDPLPNVEAVTIEWLTDVVCRDHPGAHVVDFRIEHVSSGTHARHRLHLAYDEAGRRRGLPSTLFTKTLPTLQNRMVSGITGHARTEGKFYTELRPELSLEIPWCYESTVDARSYAALHLLEDVVATKGAIFCDYRTQVTRSMIEDMVDLLATLHGHFHQDPRFANELRWAVPYAKWFRAGIRKLRIDFYTEQALHQAADRIPARLLTRKDEIWPATVAALRVHEKEPATFLHSDVHIGNWYQTNAGRMGICDWQCASHGHWSRDLAYVISAALAIEDRRSWERDLISRYVDRFAQVSGVPITVEEAWTFYRQQLFHALMMWTPTLCHSEHLPDMQPEAASLAMIERMTSAIDDLESLDAVPL